MSLTEQIEKLKAIRSEADIIFRELEGLSKAEDDVPATLLTRLRNLAAELDTAARSAARERRRQTIGELSGRIRQYDVLLSLNLSSSARRAAEAERATLVARRGYHRGRLGADFDGIVSKADVDRLAALITEVNAAVAARRKAVAYIDGVIRLGIAAAQILARIAS